MCQRRAYRGAPKRDDARRLSDGNAPATPLTVTLNGDDLMKSKAVAAGSFAAFGFAVFASFASGCSGQIALGQDDSNLGKGDIDAGSGLCGARSCATGELCCASADESCTPTCTKATSCPVYGRPCRVADSGVGEAGPAIDSGVTVDAGPPLHWYMTCGDPVCSGMFDAGSTDAGTVVCPNEGTACATKGATCGDPPKSCGKQLICDDHDPKVGGCPISSSKFKEGISYLNDADLERLHDATMQTKLATYNYKVAFGDPNQTHLGFVIEDQPQSMAVERGHDRVDLYGYVSMVVATMQVQEKEIAALKKEVARQRASCAPRK